MEWWWWWWWASGDSSNGPVVRYLSRHAAPHRPARGTVNAYAPTNVGTPDGGRRRQSLTQTSSGGLEPAQRLRAESSPPDRVPGYHGTTDGGAGAGALIVD